MLGLPREEGLAVDMFAGGMFFHRHAAFDGRVAIPVGQAVAAEAGADHQVDVLHVAARSQVGHQVPERGSVEFGLEIAYVAFPLV